MTLRAFSHEDIESKETGVPVSFQIGLVAAIALAVRLIGLDHTPFIDELNHVLAAQSLLSNGDLTIYHGLQPYDRAWLYTATVAAFQWALGSGLVASRLPSLLAGVAIALAVHVTVARAAGARAGLFAGLLIALDPGGIYLSQIARFYTAQALLIWLGGMAFVSGLSKKSVLAFVLAVSAFLLAFHLQRTTLIACVGVAVATAVLFVFHPDFSLSRRNSILAGAILAGSALAAVVSGFAGEAWASFTHALPWATDNSTNVLFYHGIMMDRYPLFWLLLPLIMIAAAVRQPALGLYMGSFVLVVFVLHSAAATKSERYIHYVMPWFFAIAGVALSWGWSLLNKLVDQWMLTWKEPLRGGKLARVLILILIVGYVGSLQPAYGYTADMLTISDHEWPDGRRRYRGKPDWNAVAERLGQRATGADLLISTNDVAAVYYFNRLDAVLSRVNKETFAGGMEFGISTKVGVPVFSQPETLESLLKCNPNVLLIAEDRHLDVPYGVPPETRRRVRERMVEIPLPTEWGISAFHSVKPGGGC